MIIYIEVLLIVNLLIHIFTIIIIKEIFYLKLRKTFYLTFIIDVFYMLGHVNNYNFLILKIMMPIVFIFLSFKSSFITTLKALLMYFLLSYTLFGLSISINISSNFNYFFIFILYSIMIIVLYVFFKRKSFNISYKIEYSFKNKNYRLNAFFDTGCNILYKGLPVVIINKKYTFNIYSSEVIYISTGTNSSYEHVFLLNELKIKNNTLKCYCVFLDIDYDAIIGVNLVSVLHI